MCGLLAAAALSALVLVAIAGAATFTNGGAAITIADSATPPTQASTYPSQITVSGEPNVSDVNVTLNAVSHTFGDDVDMLLVGPQGQSVILMSDAVGDVISNVNLTFDDEAATLLPDEDPAASGSYKPTNYGPSSPDVCPNEPSTDSWPGAPAGPYGSALSAFDGTNPNGTWSLYVVDDCPGDAGKINGGWSLTFAQPTAVTLASFSAAKQGKKAAVVRWRSASETGLLGFNLYRARAKIGSYTKLNRSLIKARGGASGHAYRYLDKTAKVGRAYRYRLQALFASGKRTWIGTTTLRYAVRARTHARGSGGGALRLNMLLVVPSASASSDPHTQFLGDTDGTTFTFSVHNTGATSIGAVQVARPTASWTITACPVGPVGWTITTSEKACTYRSAAGTGDDIASGVTSNAFQATATTAGGTLDGKGPWKIRVSSTEFFSDPTNVASASSEGPGLGVFTYSFELLDAGVVAAAPNPGDPCPALQTTAPASSTQIVVVCGRNRTTDPLTPQAATSALAGTFLSSSGSFSSGSIPAGGPASASLVLAVWSGAQVGGSPGSGMDVVADIGAASTQTAPQTTFTGFTITSTNQAPTDIQLSTSSIAENQPSGTDVGTLTTTDPDAGDTHTYTLQSTGCGGGPFADNSSFQIGGAGNDKLQSAASFDFETKSSYTICLRTTDNGTPNLSFDKQFSVSVTNVNEPPTDISLSNSSIDENQASGTAVGSLSQVGDPDSGETYTFTLLTSGCSGSFPDSSGFQVSGSQLQSAVSFNYEAKSSYAICVRVDDPGSPNLSFEKQFTITVNDVNDAPTVVNDSYSGAIGNTVATLQHTAAGPRVQLSGNLPLANDSDEDATFPHTIAAVAETNASTGGGSAQIFTDGSFVYTPGVGDKNQDDTFTYHVTDGSLTTAGTITVHIDNFLVWYVDGSSGAVTHDGRSSSPFLNLSSLNAAGGSGDSDGTGDYLFLYSGTYTGGLPLEASQKLWGQTMGLTVNGISLVAAGGTNPVIQNGVGAGIQLANGVDVQGIDVSSTGGAGIFGSAVTTATVGTTVAGAITSTTGDGVNLSGAASGDITIADSITKTGSNHSVSVANRSGGTVGFSGAINDTAGGISLGSNTGATINFTGGVVVSSGTNAAFSATGGGTVSVTGANNTLATTTGTALNVANTAIGASGLTFKSISANGAANGIVLNTTGANAGLTVTGTGSANSGGTIQNTTGHAISLVNTRAVSLDRMNIQNPANDGINGSTVTDFSLTNSTIAGAGDGANEYGVFLTNLFGTGTITGSSITNSQTNNLKVSNNSSSSAGTLTISGSTFTTTDATNGGDAVNIETGVGGSQAGNLTVKLTGNNNLNSSQGDGIQAAGNDNSTLNVTVTGTGSNYNGNLGSAVNIAGDGNAVINALVQNLTNVSTGTNGTNGLNVINIQTIESVDGGPTLNATVQNNSITTLAGGPQNASGIRLIQEGKGTLNANINNNTIGGAALAANGIVSQARAGNGQLNLTIGPTNTINLPNAAALDGVSVESGSSAGGDTNTVCLNMFNNSSSAAAQQGYRLRQRTGTTFNLQNFAGNGAVAADVTTWVNTTKSNTGTTDIVIGTAFSAAPANCPTASLPPP